jgi:hypothetical protein
MGKAWPRFLPGESAEVLAHALIIEANAIVVEQLGSGQEDLISAHQRAESYARAHYSPDDLRTAWNTCATAPENGNILLHHLVQFCPAPEPALESFGRRRHGSAFAAAQRLRSELGKTRRMTVMERPGAKSLRRLARA